MKALAEALLVHEGLDREALDEVLGDVDICLPVFAVQRAHGLLRVVQAPVPAAACNAHARR